MTEYAYKVEMTNEDCQGKRFVVFHNNEFLDFWQAGEEAHDHMYSQNCTRCGKAHMDSSYVATHIERGEADVNGVGTSYRSIYPGRHRQKELPYDDNSVGW